MMKNLSAEKAIYNEDINQFIADMFRRFTPPLDSELVVNNDSIVFMDNHSPKIKEGTYTISANQTMDGTDILADSASTNTNQKIHVNGPRFNLGPQEILSVFPPNGSSGDHTHVMPHLVLNRSTLPWEIDRKLLPWDTNSVSEKDPWLALILFNGDEMPEIKTETVGNLKFNNDADIPDPIYNPGNESITTIEVKTSLVQEILKATDLPYLSHVRIKHHAEDVKSLSLERSYIVGKRLPKAGSTSTVHLVSLVDFPMADTSENIKFVSLFNWSFTCPKEKPAFKDILKSLDTRSFRLYAENQDKTTIENKYYLNGYVPLPHFMRKGLKTLSWYRSPLLPDVRCFTEPDLTMAYGPDNYLELDNNTNMLHVTYAAAWQLGRMLTLENTPAGLAIHKLKRNVAQAIKSQKMAKSSHINFLTVSNQSENHQQLLAAVNKPENVLKANENADLSSVTFDKIISDWFSSLISLEVIPFNYLVPHDSMLPPESLRMFVLDFNWIIALLEGALSVGGKENFTLPKPKYTQDKIYSGFLLRSEVIGDYPDFHIAAYTERLTDIEEVDSGSISPSIKRKLSNDVLFCLFQMETKLDADGKPLQDTPIQTVDLFLKKEALHMGFDFENGQLEKKARDEDGKEIPEKVLNVDPYINSERAIDLYQLRAGMQNISGIPIENSHAFTLQMMEGVPKIRISVKD